LGKSIFSIKGILSSKQEADLNLSKVSIKSSSFHVSAILE
jgi:hypothetical protein